MVVSLSAKVLVKKIIFRKNFFIFCFHLCSKEKKVLYGFFICFRRDFRVRTLKYCTLGLKKVLYGFFICYQGTFWSTKNEKKTKFKKEKIIKNNYFRPSFFLGCSTCREPDRKCRHDIFVFQNFRSIRMTKIWEITLVSWMLCDVHLYRIWQTMRHYSRLRHEC